MMPCNCQGRAASMGHGKAGAGMQERMQAAMHDAMQLPRSGRLHGRREGRGKYGRNHAGLFAGRSWGTTEKTSAPQCPAEPTTACLADGRGHTVRGTGVSAGTPERPALSPRQRPRRPSGFDSRKRDRTGPCPSLFFGLSSVHVRRSRAFPRRLPPTPRQSLANVRERGHASAPPGNDAMPRRSGRHGSRTMGPAHTASGSARNADRPPCGRLKAPFPARSGKPLPAVSPDRELFASTPSASRHVCR
jgi:hypothetical protein